MTTSIDFTTPSPRFSVNDEKALNEAFEYLNEHGYVVISDVLNQSEIQTGKDLLWRFIEKASNGNISRDKPDTWSNSWPSFSTHGVFNGFGIGQSEFLWTIRSTPNIKKVFRQLWNDENLLVSFDGCGVFRDWRYNNDWKTSGGWNHVDQSPNAKPNRCCIQGLVSLTDQSDKTGGLIVYPQTHLKFTELAQYTKSTKDFFKITDSLPIMENGQRKGKLVHCRAGDLVLWDSRTIHCNSPAVTVEERRTDESVDLLRVVAYVCMSPISLITNYTLEEFRQKRQQCVEDSITLTHWPTEITPSYGKTENLPYLSIDQFTDYQKALIFGYAYKD